MYAQIKPVWCLEMKNTFDFRDLYDEAFCVAEWKLPRKKLTFQHLHFSICSYFRYDIILHCTFHFIFQKLCTILVHKHMYVYDLVSLVLVCFISFMFQFWICRFLYTYLLRTTFVHSQFEQQVYFVFSTKHIWNSQNKSSFQWKYKRNPLVDVTTPRLSFVPTIDRSWPTACVNTMWDAFVHLRSFFFVCWIGGRSSLCLYVVTYWTLFQITLRFKAWSHTIYPLSIFACITPGFFSRKASWTVSNRM